MKKAAAATVLALLASVSSPALAAVNLTGATVTGSLLYDNQSTTYAGPFTTTVGAGIEFPQGIFTGAQGRAEGSFDITSNAITFFTNQNATYSTGPFNGYRLDFSGFTGALSDLQFSSSSTFLPLRFDVVGNSVFLNLSGQTVQSGDFASLSAVPEPATWAMMLLGFGFVGGAMRSVNRRQKVTVRYA